jgi:transposase
MLIALARKLAVALWRYVETGLVPEGAVVDTVTAEAKDVMAAAT